MKMKILAVVILTLVVVAETKAKDKVTARFRPWYEKFGQDSTPKIEVVSGPKDVKMRNGGVSGKQWIATCGPYRFKLTIQDSTGVELGQLVQRLQKLPVCYMKACAAVAENSATKNPAANDPGAMQKIEAPEWTVPGIGVAMRRIPAGSFTMGSPAGELARKADEPQHKVTISKPFYMAIYETRQREYYPLMIRPDYDLEAWGYQRGPLHEGAAWTYRSLMNGRRISGGSAYPNIARTDLNPMECVAWDNAMLFCQKVTAAERAAGRLPKGYVYRLPTEAEWEYACRAGTTTPYNFKGDYDNVGVLSAYMCLSKDGGYIAFATSPTPDNRQPNAWGLYDMHGNVFEWCLDWYGPYAADAATDPVGPGTGAERVARGGGVLPFPPGRNSLEKLVHPHFRSAARYSFPARTAHQINLGFRIVLAPEVQVPGAAQPSE